MTFDDYWKALIEKNPRLEEDVVKVKKTGLYNMLKQAYDKGWEQHQAVSDKVNTMFEGYQKRANANTDYAKDILENILRGKK